MHLVIKTRVSKYGLIFSSSNKDCNFVIHELEFMFGSLSVFM